jgi:murein DD-endopeptidase MepM/ murein hydrolase activator NlpD
MKYYYFSLQLIIITFCNCSNNKASKANSLESQNYSDSIQRILKDTFCISCKEFNIVNTRVRDAKIDSAQAKKRIKILIPEIEKYFFEHGGKITSKSDWIFPIEGYDWRNIGGTNGSGFTTTGYNYYDGNEYKGHPAHDIFVFDKNQDCLDDRTNKPINVLSVSNGIVVADEPFWKAGNPVKGGKYIWIYDPSFKGFFYYSHNDSIFVKSGDLIKAGQQIAFIGRTGNAARKESPTHLHFAKFKYVNGEIIPDNPYEDLKQCKVIK